jgi:hypothetical protein
VAEGRQRQDRRKGKRESEKAQEKENGGGWRAGNFSHLRKKGGVKYSGREDSRVLGGVLSALTAVDHARGSRNLSGTRKGEE